MAGSTLNRTLYHREDNRFYSFLYWPRTHIQPRMLAQMGFYFIGPTDQVRCHFCRLILGGWDQESHFHAEHLKYSPACPLITRKATTNVPLDPEALDRALTPRTLEDVVLSPRPRPMPVRTGNISAPPQLSAIETSLQQQIKKPASAYYILKSRRFKSFQSWPISMHQKPKEMSEAGLYYLGKGDRVYCYSCGLAMKDWLPTDDPWKKHALLWQTCSYLKLMKGESYLSDVLRHRNTPVVKQESEPGTSGSIAKPIVKEPIKGKNPKRCIICFVNEYNTAFLPCGHVVACIQCAASVIQCPICRKNFTKVIRIFFP